MEDFSFPVSLAIVTVPVDSANAQITPVFTEQSDFEDRSLVLAHRDEGQSIVLYGDLADVKNSIEEYLIDWSRAANENTIAIQQTENFIANTPFHEIPSLEDGCQIAFGAKGEKILGVNSSSIEESHWTLFLIEDSISASELVRIEHPKSAMASDLRSIRRIGTELVLAGEWLTQNCSIPLVYSFDRELSEIMSPQTLWTFLQSSGYLQSNWQDLFIEDELAPEGLAIHDVAKDVEGRYWLAAELFNAEGFHALALRLDANNNFELIASRSASSACAYSSIGIRDRTVVLAGREHDGQKYSMFADIIEVEAAADSVRSLYSYAFEKDIVCDVRGLYLTGNIVHLIAIVQGDTDWLRHERD